MKYSLKNLKQQKIYIPILILVSFMIGYVFHGGPESPGLEKSEKSVSADIPPIESKVEIWTCSMHPHIKKPGPGKCPICGMTLVPVTSSGGDEKRSPREYVMSEAARKLAEVAVMPVERKYVDAEVRMVGKVDYDETKVGYITAWVPGRIDKLYVDFTGVPVKKGDHMVYLYSPELVAAQEELLQAIRLNRDVKRSNGSSIKKMAFATLESSREKLRLWGLSAKQIKDIELTGKPTDHMKILAPMSGIVVQKNAFEGMYIKTGTRIYTIADLSHLWIKLDAYESDLMWVRYGQKVEFTTVAYPGEVFTGRISFVDPVLDAKTRTVKVRVNVSNPDGKLKPEMFVRAVVRAGVAKGGRVMDPELAGKWICPMHPEILSDHAGTCKICGMPLVRTESLGYVEADASAEAPIVVPASAVLITGKRALVYVMKTEKKRPTYEGREIVIGPRTGDYYIVRSGLLEGEMVVTNGNFKIDSALQIEAKPSMMNPKGGGPAPGHQHGGMKKGGAKGKKHKMKKGKMAGGEHKGHDAGMKKTHAKNLPGPFNKQLSGLIRSYLSIQESLAADNTKGTAVAVKKMKSAFKAIDMSLLTGQAHMDWMDISGRIKKSLKKAAEADNITGQRLEFLQLSGTVAELLDRFGSAGNAGLVQLRCPMAFDSRGATWIQKGKETRNPYLGTEMAGCGEQVREIK